jgi:hypothetical protein
MAYHPEGYANFKHAESETLAQILWHYFKECGVMRDSDNVAEIYGAVEGVDNLLSTMEDRINSLSALVNALEATLERTNNMIDRMASRG